MDDNMGDGQENEPSMDDNMGDDQENDAPMDDEMDNEPPMDDEMGNEPPMDNGNSEENDNNDDAINDIQKTTGTLAQQIRDNNVKIQAKDLKYIINSILSASPTEKLSNSDVNKIVNKIKTPNAEN